MSRGHLKYCLLLSALLITLSFAKSSQAQLGESSKPSFGALTHKKVDLQRKLPPVTDVKGKTISVHSQPQTGPTAGPASELQGTIENLLTRSGTGVKVEGNNPDIVIDCTISQYDAPHYVTVGTGNTQRSELTGGMTAVFRITEPRTHHLLASGVGSSELTGTSTTTWSNLFHASPQKKYATGEEAQLVTDVAQQVASYLVVTTEVVSAMLATSKDLDNGDKLATSNLWPRALEAFETAPKNPDAKLDAYRLYNVGVINEALAYQSNDPSVALKYLQEASSDYGKALNDNPSEKYFMEPQNRIKRGLAHYTSGSDAPVDEPVAAKPDKPLNNEDIIGMAQAKLDEALILDAIKEATAIDFNLTTQGMITLGNGGVNSKIITAMKAKQASQPKKN